MHGSDEAMPKKTGWRVREQASLQVRRRKTMLPSIHRVRTLPSRRRPALRQAFAVSAPHVQARLADCFS
jgi:hypothetical protein